MFGAADEMLLLLLGGKDEGMKRLNEMKELDAALPSAEVCGGLRKLPSRSLTIFLQVSLVNCKAECLDECLTGALSCVDICDWTTGRCIQNIKEHDVALEGLSLQKMEQTVRQWQVSPFQAQTASYCDSLKTAIEKYNLSGPFSDCNNEELWKGLCFMACFSY